MIVLKLAQCAAVSSCKPKLSDFLIYCLSVSIYFILLEKKSSGVNENAPFYCYRSVRLTKVSSTPMHGSLYHHFQNIYSLTSGMIITDNDR